MKYYGQAEELSLQIIDKFKSGDIPEALAQIFIINNNTRPSSYWSWGNQLLMVFAGTMDARGYKQWQEVGRNVVKASEKKHSVVILAPLKRTIERTNDKGEKEMFSVLYGFKSIVVHAIEDTVVVDQELWDKSSMPDEETRRFVETLPLKEVAEAWGIDVGCFTGKEGKALGYYMPKANHIGLGVKNLSTWAHEMVHASDGRLGSLSRPGDGIEARSEDEVVAELGGAVLLTVLGMEKDADLGGAWNYLKAWGGDDPDKLLPLCMKLIGRVCQAVDLILKTVEEKGKEHGQS